MQIVESFMLNNPILSKRRTLDVKGLMLHSVGCAQPSAEVFIKQWDIASYTRAAVHAFIDGNTGIVYQTSQWNIRAAHCASGKSGSGNSTHIGVEMCEPAAIKYTGGTKFAILDNVAAVTSANKTYNAAVELFAYLCKKFALDPLKDGVIISHSEGFARGVASNHADPEHLWRGLGLPYTMDTFRLAVNETLKKLNGANISVGIVDTSTDEGFYYSKLRQAGCSPAGACGALGNGRAESGLRSNNLQNSFEKKLGMTDVQYTAAVDNGTYKNFVRDSAGYGLFQWTYWSRKENLFNFCKERGVSIADREAQIDFFIKEVKAYKGVWDILQTTSSVEEASDVMLYKFERPADQSDKVRDTRRKYSLEYYNKFNSAVVELPKEPVVTPTEVDPYLVRVSIDDLKIRKGPGTNYEWTGSYTGKGVFTIVAEVEGKGATKWGKLSSGAGWISLDFTEPVKVVFKPYLFRVTIDDLKIRKGPGTNYEWTGSYTGKGVFTIIEEAEGKGATKWGKLMASGDWISLDFGEKLNE